MKTVNFGTLELTVTEEEISLEVFVPHEGRVKLEMTPDELQIFSVEIGNKLHAARGEQDAAIAARNLKKELRR